VIFHDCTKNFVLKGKRGLLAKIPPHKTLFNTENKRGLPIGNLASQFFSNVYLNELDQFVKHRLKARFRYLFGHDDGKLKRIDQAPPKLRSLKRQYRFFLRRYPGSILFFQVGRFYEFYDKQAEAAMEVLGLKRVEARRGFRTRCGFPVTLQDRYRIKLVKLGFPVEVVREEEGWLSGIKKRNVAERWLPASAAASRAEF
jgi:hypothetical protein